MLGVDVGRRDRRLGREPEVEQPEADRELGHRHLVAAALGAQRDPERGEGVEVVVAERAAGPPVELGAAHLHRRLDLPRRQHRPVQRDVLGGGVVGDPGDVPLDRRQA